MYEIFFSSAAAKEIHPVSQALGLFYWLVKLRISVFPAC